MSTEKVVEKLSKQVDRRRFLGIASKAALGFLLLLSSRRIQTAEAYHTNCTNYNTVRTKYCCHLGYRDDCTSTESSNCFTYGTSHPSWWLWTCCYGTALVECRECCKYSCSKAVLTPSCGSCGGTANVNC
ncbi:hypothetical protein Tter_0548 [Thermobaculum terrenum ATCC BAA-798]|uniref:Uncharacterized protein n=1 Tax=Thermobaculum terrenum (strain ATCC BAA-798 / CCMEE 7001 / YNP1) TaxID=525904 RepID=D1CEW0_THET1|nr:hypothetical protein Tter_0548 [Thermobaculum terrenum ATCC BAA-798]